VTIKEVEAKSILRKYKKIESWFHCKNGEITESIILEILEIGNSSYYNKL